MWVLTVTIQVSFEKNNFDFRIGLFSETGNLWGG